MINRLGHWFYLKHDLSDNGFMYFECEKCKIVICELKVEEEVEAYYYMGSEVLTLDGTLKFSFSKEIEDIDNDLLTCEQYIIKQIIE